MTGARCVDTDGCADRSWPASARRPHDPSAPQHHLLDVRSCGARGNGHQCSPGLRHLSLRRISLWNHLWILGQLSRALPETPGAETTEPETSEAEISWRLRFGRGRPGIRFECARKSGATRAESPHRRAHQFFFDSFFDGLARSWVRAPVGERLLVLHVSSARGRGRKAHRVSKSPFVDNLAAAAVDPVALNLVAPTRGRRIPRHLGLATPGFVALVVSSCLQHRATAVSVCVMAADERCTTSAPSCGRSTGYDVLLPRPLPGVPSGVAVTALTPRLRGA
jgi:hypothetical protein